MITDFSKFDNNSLIQYCIQNKDSAPAWNEFVSRYDKTIKVNVKRECIRKHIEKSELNFEDVFEDLVQDVYVKLVANEFRALRSFRGQNDNSIHAYLTMIAMNCVRNYHTRTKRKSNLPVTDSIFAPLGRFGNKEFFYIIDVAQSFSCDLQNELQVQQLKEEIELILEKAVSEKSQSRDKLLFKLSVFYGFTAKEIAEQKQFDLSAKRIGNIVTRLKNIVKNELSASEKRY